MTGYNDITPRMGAAYDVFGNGKTALKVNLGKYLQGASVSNLAYERQPVAADPRRRSRSAFGNPELTRTWPDNNSNFVPDCNLQQYPTAQSPTTTGSVDDCGPIDNQRSAPTSSSARSSIRTCSAGGAVRPSDWSFGVSVQQQIFPRASVEVGYYRRSFTMYTTGGTVTDNLAIAPNDRRRRSTSRRRAIRVCPAAAATRSARSTTSTRTCSASRTC